MLRCIRNGSGVGLLLVLILFLVGCAGYSEWGVYDPVIIEKKGEKVTEYKRVPKAYVKSKGNIKVEYPSGHKVENKPVLEPPTLPPIQYEN